MKKNNILIFGAGQLGKLILKIILKQNLYNVIGFVDKKSSLLGKKILGYKIYSEKYFKENFKPIKNYVVAVGDINLRKKIILKISGNRINFPLIIDPDSKIDSEVKIEEGTIVSSSSTILCNTKIGKHCIIGTGVTILHDVTISENCIIGGGTTIGANNKFEKNILVGVGSVFASNKKVIGANSVVCAGTVVLKSIKKNSKVIGNPSIYIPK